MSTRLVVLVGVLCALLVLPVGAAGAQATATKKVSAKKVRLKAFGSCAGLVSYARKNGTRLVGQQPRPMGGPPPMGGAGEDRASGEGSSPSPGAAAPAAGGAGSDFSTTNVQEEGVDEPDVVKTDGKTIFAANLNQIHAVDARAEEPKLLSTVTLGQVYGHELLLYKDRLLVVSQGAVHVQPVSGGPEARPASSVPYAPQRPVTKLTEIDVSDPSDMKVLRTLEVDGSYLTARLNGSTARLVFNAPPRALDFANPYSQEDRPEMRRQVRRAKLAGFMPRLKLTHHPTGRKLKRRALSCRSVRRAPSFSGLDMLTVATIDFRKGLHIIDSDGVMTNAETVYGSPKNLYVATQRWLPTDADPTSVTRQTTLIHKFDVSDSESTTYRASGAVPGHLLSQWAMSEKGGELRVASTTWPIWMGGGDRPQVQSESFVSVLSESDGKLLLRGQVGGLGKGERIFAVRFIGDTGYVVTFRQVDPLYTVDVSDAANPRVVGELKIAGYSAYLHPVGENLLLGVGQDATEEGFRTGTQLSLFDVSDPAAPRRLHQVKVGTGSSSAAEFDHKAFLYWAPSNLAVIPVTMYEQSGEDGGGNSMSRPCCGPVFSGVIGFRVDKTQGFAEVGRVEHEAPNQHWWPGIRRSNVMGDRLFTLSELGLKASALDTLADRAWVPFPQPR